MGWWERGDILLLRHGMFPVMDTASRGCGRSCSPSLRGFPWDERFRGFSFRKSLLF